MSSLLSVLAKYCLKLCLYNILKLAWDQGYLYEFEFGGYSQMIRERGVNMLESQIDIHNLKNTKQTL